MLVLFAASLDDFETLVGWHAKASSGASVTVSSSQDAVSGSRSMQVDFSIPSPGSKVYSWAMVHKKFSPQLDFTECGGISFSLKSSKPLVIKVVLFDSSEQKMWRYVEVSKPGEWRRYVLPASSFKFYSFDKKAVSRIEFVFVNLGEEAFSGTVWFDAMELLPPEEEEGRRAYALGGNFAFHPFFISQLLKISSTPPLGESPKTQPLVWGNSAGISLVASFHRVSAYAELWAQMRDFSFSQGYPSPLLPYMPYTDRVYPYYGEDTYQYHDSALYPAFGKRITLFYYPESGGIDSVQVGTIALNYSPYTIYGRYFYEGLKVIGHSDKVLWEAFLTKLWDKGFASGGQWFASTWKSKLNVKFSGYLRLPFGLVSSDTEFITRPYEFESVGVGEVSLKLPLKLPVVSVSARGGGFYKNKLSEIAYYSEDGVPVLSPLLREDAVLDKMGIVELEVRYFPILWIDMMKGSYIYVGPDFLPTYRESEKDLALFNMKGFMGEFTKTLMVNAPIFGRVILNAGGQKMEQIEDKKAHLEEFFASLRMGTSKLTWQLYGGYRSFSTSFITKRDTYTYSVYFQGAVFPTLDFNTKLTYSWTSQNITVNLVNADPYSYEDGWRVYQLQFFLNWKMNPHSALRAEYVFTWPDDYFVSFAREFMGGGVSSYLWDNYLRISWILMW